MERRNTIRRRILKGLAMALMGLALIPALAQPAQARHHRGRGWGWGWGGHRIYRGVPRGYYGGYPRYGGYGYGGYAPRFYGSGYSGVGLPYGYGYIYSAPMSPAMGFYNYGVPML